MGRYLRRSEPSGGYRQPDGAAFRLKTDPRGRNPMEPPKDAKGSGTESGVQPQYGVPYGVTLNRSCRRSACRANSRLGYISAPDLKTNEVVWKTYRYSAGQPAVPDAG